MRGLAIVLGAGLLAAGCNMASEEDQLENAIREDLSSRGTVNQVELTKSDDDHMTGFATIRDQSGREGRMNCTAERQGNGSSSFNWTCTPAIDESVLDSVEGNIRETLSQQGEVIEVAMQRGADDNHMTGFARLRDGYGAEIRSNCTAERDRDNAATFSWQCRPGDQADAASASAAPAAGPAPAPAPAGDKDPAAASGGDKPAE